MHCPNKRNFKFWVRCEFGSYKSNNIELRIRNWCPIPDFLGQTIRTRLNSGKIGFERKNMENVVFKFKIWMKNSWSYIVFSGRINSGIQVECIFAGSTTYSAWTFGTCSTSQGGKNSSISQFQLEKIEQFLKFGPKIYDRIL